MGPINYVVGPGSGDCVWHGLPGGIGVVSCGGTAKRSAWLNWRRRFQEGVAKRGHTPFSRICTWLRLVCAIPGDGRARLGLGALFPFWVCQDVVWTGPPHSPTCACTSGFGPRLCRASPEKHSCQMHWQPLCPPSIVFYQEELGDQNSFHSSYEVWESNNSYNILRVTGVSRCLMEIEIFVEGTSEWLTISKPQEKKKSEFKNDDPGSNWKKCTETLYWVLLHITVERL